jgi:hypothetical protein
MTRQFAPLYYEEYGAGVMNLTTRQLISVNCQEYKVGVMNLTTRSLLLFTVKNMEQEL